MLQRYVPAATDELVELWAKEDAHGKVRTDLICREAYDLAEEA